MNNSVLKVGMKVLLPESELYRYYKGLSCEVVEITATSFKAVFENGAIGIYTIDKTKWEHYNA